MSSAAPYLGDPPPSFVLRKFAPEEAVQPIETPSMAASFDVRPCDDARPFQLKELAVRSLALSNQDPRAALHMLSAMGCTVLETDSRNPLGVAAGYSCDELPVVVANVEASDGSFSFVPEGMASQHDAFGASSGAINRMDRSHSGDVDQLLVFYHPERLQDLQRIESLIGGVIDQPAAQVYIEGWVLEVSQEASKELGVRYRDSFGDDGEFSLGATSVDSAEDVLDFLRDKTAAVMPAQGLRWTVRALVEDGEAEILSRPSLLALSNRQAVIQIMDVVQYPLVERTVGDFGTVTSGLDFGEISIGITLNLRPRVSADRKWVHLELDAVVDAEDEENAGQAISIDPASGETFVAATKPGFSSRRMRTFARIPDRTPIVVGGLVSKEDSTIKRRLPGLGDLPVAGPLFGATDTDHTQREIMIILTPYVLAEDAIGVAANTPRESEHFDDRDMQLFDERYRLRAEDLFDLRSLTNTPRFVAYLRKIHRATRRGPEEASKPHYAAFLGGDMPGGEALVARTFFDLVEKLDLGAGLDLNEVRIVQEHEGELVGTTLNDVLWLARTTPVELRADPDSSARVRAVVGVEAAGTDRTSVRLHGEDDVRRFVSALVAREMIRVNGGLESLRIRNLNVGQFITLPPLEEGSGMKVDEEVLRTYENSVRYEQVVFVSLEEAFRRIDLEPW